MLPLMLLLALLASVASVTDASLRTDASYALPILDNTTTPFLQWRARLGRGLLNADLARLAASAPTDFAVSSQGSGLFVVTGSASSRRRASNGLAGWLTHDPNNGTCTSPFIPDVSAEASTHWYAICGDRIVKRWYDTGEEQWSVQVMLEDGKVARLTRIVGLTSWQAPQANGTEETMSGLLAEAGDHGVLVLIDARNGSRIRQFGPSMPANPFPHPPPFNLDRLASISAYVPDRPGNCSKDVIVLARILTVGLGGDNDNGVGAEYTQPLLAFRLDFPSLTISSDGWWLALNDGTQSVNVKVSVADNIGGLLIRAAIKPRYGTQRHAIWMVDGYRNWTIGVSPAEFPFDANLLVSNDPDHRFIMPSRLVLASHAGAPAVLLPLIVLNPVGGRPSIDTLDVSHLVPPSILPVHLFIDPSNNLLHLSAFLLASWNLNELDLITSRHVPPFFEWKFQSFESWSSVGPDGLPTGRMTIKDVDDEQPLTHIQQVQIMPDRETGGSFYLVTGQDAANMADGSLTAFAFGAHPAPACQEVSNNDCDRCQRVTGTLTARQCAYCFASSTCMELEAPGVAAHGQRCADPSFGQATAPSCPSSETDWTNTLIVAVLVVFGVVFILIIPIAYLIRRSRRSMHEDEQLKRHYLTLSPEHDPSMSRHSRVASEAINTPTSAMGIHIGDPIGADIYSTASSPTATSYVSPFHSGIIVQPHPYRPPSIDGASIVAQLDYSLNHPGHLQ